MVTDRYKLVHFYETPVDYWELFDLQKDPRELKSVYDSSEYSDARKQLEQELARLRKQFAVPESDPPRAFGNAPIDRPAAVPKKSSGGTP